MVMNLIKKIVGTQNDRQVKRMNKTVKKIDGFEEQHKALSDDELKALTVAFRARLDGGEDLDQLLPEAFSAVREAAGRCLGLRHYGVQMMGGMTLHGGNIAEMRTGEGKTLVATLAVYLNAISGKGVHVITVNDYLASRDAEWMRPVYEALGLTVGVNVPGLHPTAKAEAYQCDITYGTNTEFGFDYLRDNMAHNVEQRVQRPLHFAIVDEVDSILIDEARTPLIISGAAQDSSDMYRMMNGIAPTLKLQPTPEEGEELEDDQLGDFTVDEKHRSVELTEAGHERVEGILTSMGLLKEDESLYAPANLQLMHFLYSSLRAHNLFFKEQHYIVNEGEVVLIDEHTGRTMEGRRLSEGLHQAIEAKEGVNIQQESQTLASTTYQNYFRLYEKIGGMTGTADTEAFEFRQIYGLDCIVMPTHRPVARKDMNDLIFMTKEEKYKAIIEDVKSILEGNAPILVGTATIEESEEMSRILRKAGIKHEVLNAKQHDREADIIAQAGRPKSVTVATNMAGRGTDIVLGGSWEAEVARLKSPTDAKIEEIKAAWKERHALVLEAGGLHIIGTVRHESRRIDNQLRGRAGRQGDPGLSRFYLSLDDDLMRIFAGERVRNMMTSLGMKDGEAIEHRMVSNAIEKAQRRVEGRNFDIRKSLLEFDDVANEQRREIYNVRNEILEADEVSGIIEQMRFDVVNRLVDDYVPPMSLEENWDLVGLERALETDLGIKLEVADWVENDRSADNQAIKDKVLKAIEADYLEKYESIGESMKMVEKQITLQVVDQHWKEHLANMDALRQGVNLRAYAQKNPKQEYKRESFDLFANMLDDLKFEIIKFLSLMQINRESEVEELERRRAEEAERELRNATLNSSESSAQAAPKGPKVGRNDPCPCGSGKKFKQCHGKLN